MEAKVKFRIDRCGEFFYTKAIQVEIWKNKPFGLFLFYHEEI